MTLVIGFGNPLRGDDAVGPAVAAAVRTRRPDLWVLTPHQLLPELADAVSDATAVVFVDACADAAPGRVDSRALAGSAGRWQGDHAASPDALLALTGAVYGHAPPAWLVTIGARSWAYDTALSPEVAAALPAAIEMVLRLADVVPGQARPA